ncbi:MAG TPA: thioredoxin domain-containing protein [Chloroflexia bacterium]|nr:thioredoxin domain-containing protein [Chloroflexia bacterium]
MPNRLAGETSPYLLQHKDNPVDWFPWGEEAFRRAAEEDRPIFLSVGYSACHWCHVMAHESFEDQEIARYLNEHFVSIKVDREERPDVDAVYMDAVQAMTGQGGWPMTVFLTPTGEPFYGGTYFPAREGRGMPSFPRVLEGVTTAYRERKAEIGRAASEMATYIRSSTELPPSRSEPSAEVLDDAARNLHREFDPVHGGTLGAPKFPQAMNIEFLLKQYRRTGDQALLDAALTTLRRMAQGGIYDQVGGGFHRYSVDEVWLVPHFEKMLYDNALLARVYLSAYQVTGEALYRRITEETLDYVLREMTAPEGGFYSAQDADSEGEEGRFYLWTPEQLSEVLGSYDARLLGGLYDVTERGNFEGRNILHLELSPEEFAAAEGLDPGDVSGRVTAARKKLYEARAQRAWPGRDDKVLVAWNGLMLRALSEAGIVLERDDYLHAARQNAEFVTTRLVAPSDGGPPRLYRTFKDGRAHINAFAEDYAAYANGLISLYEATFDTRWVALARRYAGTLVEHFWDERGGFFTTGDFHEQLVARPKELYDNAVPSGNSEAAEALLRLYLLTAEPDYEKYSVESMRPLLDVVRRAPAAFGRLLSALDFYLSSPAEIALVGTVTSEEIRSMMRAIWGPYVPNKVVAGREPEDEEAARVVPLLADRPQVRGMPTAYVCRNYICEAPTTDPAEVARQITRRPAGGTLTEV